MPLARRKLAVAIAAVALGGRHLVLSVAASWIAYGKRTRGSILLGTLVFGLSVFAVHFIAMAGTGFVGLDGGDTAGPALSDETLAMGVAISSFVICGAFLLSSVTFFAVRAERAAETEEPMTGTAPGRVPVPYAKEGRTQFVDAGAIAAVRAEGHCTVLYSGAERLFCPWSISEAAKRLAPAGLIRAHRSYLVNPALVTEFRRTKDTGVCHFDGVEALSKVPVSRSRLAEVRRVLGV
ncbi:LytTR family transcriptional regulator DNA-binding domain-containing protein [Mameliella alba]|uniref:LytTR family transcriptional regulator DNA-binding domain-containing protein n=1 Tax=Mameliella alba TaxID=561184 RepID=UPI0028F70864|nr:LytTR family transcriptional regulator DNA-binding domain-containing protein [Mameliella alba]